VGPSRTARGARLLALGVAPGDVVAYQLPNWWKRRRSSPRPASARWSAQFADFRARELASSSPVGAASVIPGTFAAATAALVAELRASCRPAEVLVARRGAAADAL
jgi:hypothetical protein